MSHVRPAIDADVPAVARLFQQTLKHSEAPPPEGLTDYLRHLFVSGPDRQADLPSLVCEDEGRVIGFIGIIALPLAQGDTPLRGAVCCCLMVDPTAGNVMAGAQLLRAYLAGPQDISVSETANDISAAMYRGARGMLLPDYSLDWVRVISPARFALELGADKFGPLRLLAPLVAPFDALSRRRAGGRLRWMSLAVEARNAKTPVAKAVGAEDFAQILPDLLEDYDIRPDWQPQTLRRMLDDAARKSAWGEIAFQVVAAPSGRPIGGFIYHARPGGIARVLQIVHRRGQADAVVDAMLRHSAEAGLAAVRGRTQPSLLQAMLNKRIGFVHVSTSVVQARDPAHLRAFAEGRAFFNGLAGDYWTRLIGDNLG